MAKFRGRFQNGQVIKASIKHVLEVNPGASTDSHQWGDNLLGSTFGACLNDIKNNARVIMNNDFWVTSEAICQ